MRLLGHEAVAELLDHTELLDALAVAMADLSAGRASVPARIAATVGDAGLLATMPGYSPTLGALVAKVLTLYPGNAGTSTPTHQAVIAAFDPATGALTALMDGDVITATRTAAGSALATRLLARQDARVLAILGTGPQARAHALLTAPVRAFDEVLVAGRDPASTATLAADLAAQGLPVRACGIDEAVDGADVLCATTSAVEPLVHRGRVHPGTHVSAVGYVPRGGELDPALFGDALVVVEHRATVLQPFPVGSNDLLDAIEAGIVAPGDLVEIGEVVAGGHPGRTSHEQITLYRSVGLAVQDAAAVAVVLAAAKRTGAGLEVDL